MSEPTATLSNRLWDNRALLAVIVGLELLAIIVVSTMDQHNHVDGEVYQLAAKAWLAGRDFYESLPPTETGLELPFIYPPFAAIVFTPLALVSKPVAITVITILTHLTLLITLYVVLGASTFLAARRDKIVLITAAVLPLATVSEPVRETIGYSQINTMLMAMIVVDCLWRINSERPLPYPRGLLIGLAAGLKLTPAVFLLFFLLRRDYRAILISVLSFLGTALIGLALAFHESGQFWTREIFASAGMSFGPGFVGNTGVYAGNQSLRGVLSKLSLTQPWMTVAFGLLALLVLVLAIAGMVHAIRQRDLGVAMAINAVAGLLVSPISWSHHWVLALPALVLVWGSAFGRKDWPVLLASSFATSIFFIAPHWSMPQGKGRELRWDFFEHLVGSSYVWLGMTFLLYSATVWWRAGRAKRAVTMSVSVPA